MVHSRVIDFQEQVLFTRVEKNAEPSKNRREDKSKSALACLKAGALGFSGTEGPCFPVAATIA